MVAIEGGNGGCGVMATKVHVGPTVVEPIEQFWQYIDNSFVMLHAHLLEKVFLIYYL